MYVRNLSPYRQMTDVVAVVAYLIAHAQNGPAAAFQAVAEQEGMRFSPIVVSFLSDPDLQGRLAECMTGNDSAFYRELYEKKGM